MIIRNDYYYRLIFHVVRSGLKTMASKLSEYCQAQERGEHDQCVIIIIIKS